MANLQRGWTTKVPDSTVDAPTGEAGSVSTNAPKDTVSVADSAYVSLAHSSNTTAANAQMDGICSPPRKPPRKVPGTENLLIFFGRTHPETVKHYHRVRPVIEGLLIDELTNSEFDAGTVATRLLVIGEAEEEASHRLVIFCEAKAASIVQSLLESAHMKPFLRPREERVPKLEPLIIPREPRMMSTYLDVDVCCSNAYADHTTYCGAPIVLRSACGDSNKFGHQATFGGIIKINRANGESELYGMMAGHAVQELVKSESQGWDMAGWICEHNILGSILDPSMLPGVAAGQAQPSHDWALFNIKTPKPNIAASVTCHDHNSLPDTGTHQILVAKRPQFQDEVSDPVLLLGGSHGFRRGELASSPARLWVAQSKVFVDAYMLELEDGAEVRPGDSGAWVVHSAAPELYGHVVASDDFGDAYVIPATDTLDNIRECMGAISVQLPDKNDTVLVHSDDDQKKKVGASISSSTVVCDGVETHYVESNDYSECGHGQVSEEEGRSHHSCYSAPLTPDKKQPEAHRRNDDTKRCYSRRQKAQKRATKQKYPVLSALRKRWDPVFYTHRSFGVDQSFADVMKWTDEDGDTLNVFLKHGESASSSRKYQEIKDFCDGPPPYPTAASKTFSAVPQAKAWLTETYNSDPSSQQSWNSMTAEQLQMALQAGFGLGNLSDTNIGLLHIQNLDPAFVRAIASTAPYLVANSLKRAIWNHIARRASVRVHIPMTGFRSFALEFHIPHLVLRDSPPTGHDWSSKASSKPLVGWSDVSFLKSPRPSDGDHGYFITESQTSILIWGTTNSRWIAYSFSNSGTPTGYEEDEDEGDEEDEDEDDDSEEEGEGKDQPEKENLVGRIGIPISDPREYFLAALSCRLRYIVDEWAFIVRTVKRAVDHQGTCHGDANWIGSGVILLNQLNAELSGTLSVLTNFLASDGDIGYFSDTKGSSLALYRRDVSEALMRLKESKCIIELLNSYCQQRIKMFSLRVAYNSHQLNLESHRAALESHRAALESHRLSRELNRVVSATHKTEQKISLNLTLATYIIWPVTAVATFFSIPGPVFGFERGAKSFLVGMVISFFAILIMSLGMVRAEGYWRSSLRHFWNWRIRKVDRRRWEDDKEATLS